MCGNREKKDERKKSQNNYRTNVWLFLHRFTFLALCFVQSTPVAIPATFDYYTHFSLVSIRQSSAERKESMENKRSAFLFSRFRRQSRPSVDPTSVNIYCPFTIRCAQFAVAKFTTTTAIHIVGPSSLLWQPNARALIPFFLSRCSPFGRDKQWSAQRMQNSVMHAPSVSAMNSHVGFSQSYGLRMVIADSPVSCAALYAVNEASECAWKKNPLSVACQFEIVDDYKTKIHWQLSFSMDSVRFWNDFWIV